MMVSTVFGAFVVLSISGESTIISYPSRRFALASNTTYVLISRYFDKKPPQFYYGPDGPTLQAICDVLSKHSDVYLTHGYTREQARAEALHIASWSKGSIVVEDLKLWTAKKGRKE
jgi:hypothetical protein